MGLKKVLQIRFSKSEYRLFSNISVNAGVVSFALLLAAIFIDKKDLKVILSSLVTTLFFWGLSWLLTRRFKL